MMTEYEFFFNGQETSAYDSNIKGHTLEELNKMMDDYVKNVDSWPEEKILISEDIIKSTETEEYVIKHYKKVRRLYYQDLLSMFGIINYGSHSYWEQDENGEIKYHI